MEAKKPNFKNGFRHSERYFEVNKIPNTVIERFPLHAGNCVLHLSKLILAKFVMFLHECLMPESFCLIYTGYKF